MQQDFIPIPSEIPKSPDLSNAPHFVVMSKSVESLIGQNEDLMARLKVNIRQNLLLESQLQDHQRTILEFKAANSNLNSQAEILKEKDELLRSKLAQYEAELLETLGALQESESKNRKLHLLESYQRRVRSWVRGMLSKMQYQLKLQKQKNQELENDILEQQSKASSFKTKMNDAVLALQIKEREHQKDIARLIEDFENKSAQTQKDLQNYLAENKNLKQKLQKFHEMQKDFIETQSLAEDLEQKLTILKTESNRQIESLTHSQQKLVQEVQATKLRNEILEKQNAEFQIENRQLSARSHETASRAEAMNVLWNETQIQRAQLKIKNEAMIKLNQALSLRLKDQKNQVIALENFSEKEKDEQLQNIQEIEKLMNEIEIAVTTHQSMI